MSSERKPPQSERPQNSQESPDQINLVADILDFAQEDASALKEYIDDPAAFAAKMHEERALAKKEGFFMGNDAETLRLLYNAGVRPDDLIEMGKREAMRADKMFVFRKQLRSASALKLRFARMGLEMIARGAGKVVDDTFSHAHEIIDALIPDPMASISIRPALFDINPTHALEVGRYNDAFHFAQETWDMVDAIKREIENWQPKQVVA